jgi:hypothetical protein
MKPERSRSSIRYLKIEESTASTRLDQMTMEMAWARAGFSFPHGSVHCSRTGSSAIGGIAHISPVPTKPESTE